MSYRQIPASRGLNLIWCVNLPLPFYPIYKVSSWCPTAAGLRTTGLQIALHATRSSITLEAYFCLSSDYLLQSFRCQIFYANRKQCDADRMLTGWPFSLHTPHSGPLGIRTQHWLSMSLAGWKARVYEVLTGEKSRCGFCWAGGLFAIWGELYRLHLKKPPDCSEGRGRVSGRPVQNSRMETSLSEFFNFVYL